MTSVARCFLLTVTAPASCRPALPKRLRRVTAAQAAAAAGQDSERPVQPRQTDAVDWFGAREANGYKAGGFSRQSFYINESQ